MACRNLDQSKAVQREIISATENQQVYLKEVDISSFGSIQTFCRDINHQFSRLDILIHNAAYFIHGEAYQDIGIKVNALQINGARMSKETLKKFSPAWRVVARIQNLFFPKPEFTAQNYFSICTSEAFKNTTGKQFNQRQEIMQPGPEKPAFKGIWGADYYPVYANRPEIQEKVWALCLDLTDGYLKHRTYL